MLYKQSDWLWVMLMIINMITNLYLYNPRECARSHISVGSGAMMWMLFLLKGCSKVSSPACNACRDMLVLLLVGWSTPPYRESPTIGCPTWAMCTLIWCVRPVAGDALIMHASRKGELLRTCRVCTIALGTPNLSVQGLNHTKSFTPCNKGDNACHSNIPTIYYCR